MAISYPSTNREKAELFVNAIHEIRVRLRSIDAVKGNQMGELMMYEFCQLQLRLCAECLAVGCLAAQGDFDAHKAFRDDYSVPNIFKALADVYPDFFPRPNTTYLNEGAPAGTPKWHFDPVTEKPNAITREDVEQIWQRSGNHLHRTSAKKYIKRTNEVDFLETERFKERFWHLLEDQMIMMEGGNAFLYVQADRATDALRCIHMTLNHEDGTAHMEQFAIDTPS